MCIIDESKLSIDSKKNKNKKDINLFFLVPNWVTVSYHNLYKNHYPQPVWLHN